jgi:predicted nucleic acid-binding protein
MTGPHLVLIDVTRLIGELAREIIWEHGVRPADAVHIASALYAQVDVLQTTDDRLLRRNGQIRGLRIEKPRWTGQLQLPENA